MKFSEIIARICPGVFTHSGPTAAGSERQQSATTTPTRARSFWLLHAGDDILLEVFVMITTYRQRKAIKTARYICEFGVQGGA